MKRLKYFALVLVVLFSLTLNVATVAFSSLAIALSTLFEAVTGTSAVVSELRRRAEVKDARIVALDKENKATNKKSAQLTQDVATKDLRIASLAEDFGTLEQKNRKLAKGLAVRETDVASLNGKVATLSSQLTQKKERVRKLDALLADPKVTYRSKSIPLDEAVSDTVSRISHRTAVGSGRNVAAVFAEGVPVFGIGVAVAVTGYELKDGCDTLTDLRELELALNPKAVFSEDAKVACGTKVPTRDEVWEMVRNSPGEAWIGASDYLSELPEWSVSNGWERTKHLTWVGWYRFNDGFDQTWRRVFGD